MPRNRQRSFRSALLTLVLGSLACTVGVIGVIGFTNSMRSLNELKARQYSLTSSLMRLEIKRLLRAPSRLLESLDMLVKRGLLPVDDSDAMAEILGQMLRTEPNLSWLSYSDAETGRFMGAWRDEGGAIVLNTSDPRINNGLPQEERLMPDGSRIPMSRDLEPGYDPRERDWFRQAVQAGEPVWSDIYQFNSGESGITLSRPVISSRTQKVSGVLTADFSLQAIDRFLEQVGNDRQRVLILATPDGGIMGSVTNLGGESAMEIRNLLVHLPEKLSNLVAGRPLDFSYRQEGEKMLAMAERDEVMSGLEVIAIIAATERQFLGSVLHNARVTVIVGFVSLLLATVIAFILAARMARPLSSISEELARVAEFDLSQSYASPTFVREISVVDESVQRMKAGLRSFGKYVPTTLVRRLIMQGREAQLGGEEKVLSILFSDLTGFTRMSENLTPAETVEVMREYFELAIEEVETHEGTVDKFLGDGILAFFNAPQEVEEHARQACETALRIRDRLATGAMARESEGRPRLRIRIGIATGPVLVGNIGTNDRFAYTVLGDTANLAARLETLNKQYGTAITAAESTVVETGASFEWRCLDRVAVFGRTSGTTVYELLGEKGQINAKQCQARDQYEEALEAYFAGDFSQAAAGFRAALELQPGDEAGAQLLARAERLQTQPPAGWNGVFVSAEK